MVFYRQHGAQTPTTYDVRSDVYAEQYRRDRPNAAIFVVCAPLKALGHALEKIDCSLSGFRPKALRHALEITVYSLSDIRPRVCVILGITRWLVT